MSGSARQEVQQHQDAINPSRPHHIERRVRPTEPLRALLGDPLARQIRAGEQTSQEIERLVELGEPRPRHRARYGRVTPPAVYRALVDANDGADVRPAELEAVVGLV